jgi:hypothetical protein
LLLHSGNSTYSSRDFKVWTCNNKSYCLWNITSKPCFSFTWCY